MPNRSQYTTFMSRKNGVAPQTNEAATYHSNMYTSSLCCSAVRLVRVTLERATPHSLPIHHGSVRSGPVQASPAICPCKRRCLPFAKQALPLSLNRNVAYWSSSKEGEQVRGYKRKHLGKDPFRFPPIADFGADTARYFDDHTMGVHGTHVRPRGYR